MKRREYGQIRRALNKNSSCLFPIGILEYKMEALDILEIFQEFRVVVCASYFTIMQYTSSMARGLASPAKTSE